MSACFCSASLSKEIHEERSDSLFKTTVLMSPSKRKKEKRFWRRNIYIDPAD